MDPTGDIYYIFRSIRQLTIGEGTPMQRLYPPRPWMIISISGAGVAQIQHQRHLYMLTAQGALLSYEGGESVALQAEPESEPWTLYYIEFDRLQQEETGRAGPAAARQDADSTMIMASERGRIDELCARAERLYYAAYRLEDRHARALRVQLELQEILLRWHAVDSRPAAQQTTEEAVRDVQHEMELRYEEEWRREAQAARAGIAEAYFSVLFKKLTGVQPSVYLDRLRVHRAAELLLQARGGKGDLADIARQVGYRDAWYLSKRFRSMMGIGPAEYRKRYVPQRVAALQYPYTHHLLALGIEPVVARLGSYPDTRAAQLPDGCVELPALLTMESQKQLLQEHRLDHILTYEMEDMRARWRQAAPVAYIPWLGMDWREHLRTIARLFQRVDEATTCIQAIDGLAAELRQQLHGESGPRTVSIIKVANQRYYLYGVRDVGCIFYELLGFEPPELIRRRLVKEPNLHSIEITMPQLVDHVADLQVLIIVPDQEEPLQSMWMHEHWRAFETAAAGRILYLDHREWLHYDPIHLQRQLGKVREMMPALQHMI